MTTTQPQQLKPGDVRQDDDQIQENGKNEYHYDRTHTVTWRAVRPVATHTIGRVILSSDLMNARFFRL